jgi:hypothetical protein
MKGKNKELQLARLMILALEPWNKADCNVNIGFNTSLPHYHSFKFSYVHYFYYNNNCTIYEYSQYLSLTSSTGHKMYSIYQLH